MPLERSDFRRNIVDLLDRALTGGVVIDSGVAPSEVRAAWPSNEATPPAEPRAPERAPAHLRLPRPPRARGVDLASDLAAD